MGSGSTLPPQGKCLPPGGRSLFPGGKGFHARGLLEVGLRPLRVGVCPLGPKGYGAYRAICRGLPPGGKGLPLGGMGVYPHMGNGVYSQGIAVYIRINPRG